MHENGLLPRRRDFDVVVVGAGVAGLSAAHRLGKEDPSLSVALLEAEAERIGGRVHTVQLNGQPLELGAQWIHGRGENPLWKFVQEQGIPIHSVANPDGEGRFYRVSDGEQIPERILKETLEELDRIHEDLDKFSRSNEKHGTKVPRSVGHYFEEEFEKWLKREEIEREPEEDTAWRRQFFDWYIRWEECDAGCDNLYRQSAVSWGEYVDYDHDTSFEDGFETVIQSLRDGLGDRGEVLLGRVVQSIDSSSSSNSTVIVRCQSGEEFSARHVIVTVSLGCLKERHETVFKPPLPERTRRAIEGIDFGTIDRIKLDFERPFWDPPGVHLLWDDDVRPRREVAAAPVTEENWTRHVVGFDVVNKQPNMLMAWVSGEAARIMEALSDEEVGESLCRLLRRALPRAEVSPLRAVVVTRWFTNPFQRGVYSYRSPEADQLNFGPWDLGGDVSVDGSLRVLLAGEASDERHYGTVHGALFSGRREADRILEFRQKTAAAENIF